MPAIRTGNSALCIGPSAERGVLTMLLVIEKVAIPADQEGADEIEHVPAYAPTKATFRSSRKAALFVMRFVNPPVYTEVLSVRFWR